MGLNHFAYLVQAPGQSRTSSDQLELLAKTASKRYLDERVPLNETIAKLAEDNDLNSQQIARVCEMANMSTHQALFPRATDKVKVAFPLADHKAVQRKDAPKRSGATMSDYDGPPKSAPTSGPDLKSMLGCDPSPVHDGGKIPERKQIVIILQKKASERRDMRDKCIMSQLHAETAEKLAFDAVKQAILGGESFGNLLRAAASMGLDKIALELLPVFEKRLIEETHGTLRNRLVKMAIQKAPQELISENLGSRTIVNGANPVMVSLDTVQQKNGIVKNNLANLLRIDDEIKIHSQKMRELS